MSKQTPTPGPWRLDDEKHAHIVDTDYHVIEAGQGFYGHGEGGFELCGFMSTADARLIASAPLLLEVLRAAVHWHAVQDKHEPWMVAARAAIAAATGESPDAH